MDGGGRGTKNITLDELREYFDKPIEEAARAIGVCSTLLKKICRKHHIKRWPYRQVKSLDRIIGCLKLAAENAGKGGGGGGEGEGGQGGRQDLVEEGRLLRQIKVLEARREELICHSASPGSTQPSEMEEGGREGGGLCLELASPCSHSMQSPTMDLSSSLSSSSVNGSLPPATSGASSQKKKRKGFEGASGGRSSSSNSSSSWKSGKDSSEGGGGGGGGGDGEREETSHVLRPPPA